MMTADENEGKNTFDTATKLRGLRPNKAEWLMVVAILGFFTCLNLFTCNLYPSVWCDEVWFSEPASNFVLNGSFSTTTWPLQPGNTFPAVNCPLYLLSLVPWLKMVGTSLVAIRSFNYALMALAGFLLWKISWRFNLVNSSGTRLLLLISAFLGYGTSFAYRCSRPDVLALVCLLLMALTFSIRLRVTQQICLGILGAAAMWIGFQVGLYAWLACVLGWYFLRLARFRDVVVLTGGLFVGLVSVLLFFASKGVLSYFLPMVIGWLGKRYAHGPHISFGHRISEIVGSCLYSYVADFSTLALMVGLLILLALRWNGLQGIRRRFCLYCLGLSLGTPVVFNLVGHFMFYYSYTQFVPTLLAFFVAWTSIVGAEVKGAHRDFTVRLFSTAAVSAALVLGLPLRLATGISFAHIVPRSEIQRVITSRVDPSDVVFAEHAAFFESKRAAKTVYGVNYATNFYWIHVQGHGFAPEEKDRINVLVIHPERADFATNFFGGQWTPITGPFGDTLDSGRLQRLPLIGKRIVHYLQQPQVERHPLQIFRRRSI